MPDDKLKELTEALHATPYLGEDCESICDAIPVPIVIVDAEGIISLVNREAEFLTFYSRKELLGAKVEILVPVTKREQHVTHRGEYIQNPHRREMGAGMALSVRRKDGTEIPVEIQLEHVIRPEGRLTVTALRRKDNANAKGSA